MAYAADGAYLDYNEMQIIWGPNTVTENYGIGYQSNGVIVAADSRWNAALLVCKVSVLDKRLTHDVMLKLSDESTGGKFWVLAQKFSSAERTSTGYHYPPWLESPNAFVDVWAESYGGNNIWFAAYTDSDLNAAIEDLNVILDGGSLGAPDPEPAPYTPSVPGSLSNGPYVSEFYISLFPSISSPVVKYFNYYDEENYHSGFDDKKWVDICTSDFYYKDDDVWIPYVAGRLQKGTIDYPGITEKQKSHYLNAALYVYANDADLCPYYYDKCRVSLGANVTRWLKAWGSGYYVVALLGFFDGYGEGLSSTTTVSEPDGGYGAYRGPVLAFYRFKSRSLFAEDRVTYSYKGVMREGVSQVRTLRLAYDDDGNATGYLEDYDYSQRDEAYVCFDTGFYGSNQFATWLKNSSSARYGTSYYESLGRVVDCFRDGFRFDTDPIFYKSYAQKYPSGNRALTACDRITLGYAVFDGTGGGSSGGSDDGGGSSGGSDDGGGDTFNDPVTPYVYTPQKPSVVDHTVDYTFDVTDGEGNTYTYNNTYNYSDEIDIDLTPVTERLDTIVAYLRDIDSRLNSLSSLVSGGFEDVYQELVNLGTYLGGLLVQIRDNTSASNTYLLRIYARLGVLLENLPDGGSSSGGVDFSEIERLLEQANGYLSGLSEGISVTLPDMPDYTSSIRDIYYRISKLQDILDNELNIYYRLSHLITILNWLQNFTVPDYSGDLENLAFLLENLESIDTGLRSFSDGYREWIDDYRLWCEELLDQIEGLGGSGNTYNTYNYDYGHDYDVFTDPADGPLVPVDPGPLGYPLQPVWTEQRDVLNIPALEHALEELFKKFPFNMLDQLVRIVVYVEREPVAPKFDVPMPNPSDWGRPYMLRVDLSQFDEAAAVLRMGLMVWMCARVAQRTVKMWMHDRALE